MDYTLCSILANTAAETMTWVHAQCMAAQQPASMHKQYKQNGVNPK
jgi:hypothetical protein